MFNSTGPHYCQTCPPIVNKRGSRIDEPLDLTEENYSGLGVSMANCPRCGKGYCISYKVDTIEHDSDWDIEIKENQSDIEFVKNIYPDAEAIGPITLYWPEVGERIRIIILANRFMSRPEGEGETVDEAWASAARRLKGQDNQDNLDQIEKSDVE